MSTEWKVVPVEPTPEMVAAAFHGVIEPQDCLAQQRGRERMAEFYRLMLAASPQPAAQPEQPEPVGLEHLDAFAELRARCEAGEALLRKIRHDDFMHDSLRAEIDAHLKGAGQ